MTIQSKFTTIDVSFRNFLTVYEEENYVGE